MGDKYRVLIDTHIWCDETFREVLSLRAHMALFWCYSQECQYQAQGTPVVHADVKMMAEQLGYSIEQTKIALQELEGAGFIKRKQLDQQKELIFLTDQRYILVEPVEEE